MSYHVISYVCVSWKTSRLARPQSSTFMSSDGHFGIDCAVLLWPFKDWTENNRAAGMGKSDLQSRQWRDRFFLFFVSYSVCFSSKCQATKLSKKPSKAPKVRPTQTKQYRSKTWHGAFEHWTIEFLCRHHWPKHSGVKQESRHHLRTLQQLQRLAYTCNIWTWYLSCLRHLHGLVVHARLHSV